MASRNELETSSLIKEAYDKGRRHRWIEAAELCRQALSDTGSITEVSTLGELTDFSAECHFKGAFQARNRKEFEELITISKAACKKSSIIYDDTGQLARSQRAKSGILIAEFWLQRDSTQRAGLARKIVNLYEESARAFEDSGESREALKTRLDLLRFCREFINLSTDFRALRNTFDRAVQVGSAMLDSLRKQEMDDAMIETLGLMVWLFAVEAEVVMTPSEFQSLADRTRGFQAELVELSCNARTPISISTTAESAGHVAFDLAGDPAQALHEYEEGLKIATTLGNSLAIGRLHWICSQAACWLGYSENDPQKKRRLFTQAEAHSQDSIRNLEISFQTTELSAAHTVRSQCLIELANLTGLDLQTKKTFLEKAVEVAAKGATYESATWAWSLAALNLSKALYLRSRLEAPERRLGLLREALTAREKIAQVNENLFPLFWNNIVGLYHLALVRSEVAAYESDPTTKKDLLDKAISEMELCLKLGEPWRTTPGFPQRLAEHSEAYGEILSKLRALTGDPSLGDRAIKALETAINNLGASQSPTIARLKWKIARIYHDLRAFQQASVEFKKAADNYREAASELPGSALLFEDIGRYLDAWSVIETARMQHDEGEYLSSSERYNTVAYLLGQTREWAYLSPLFSARSLLEKGEGLSSEERHPSAIESFKVAIERFGEEAETLERKIRGMTDPSERGEVERWLTIAGQREAYCRGRLELEQARIFDKKGDKRESAKKFRNSAKIFADLQEMMPDVQDRGELEGLAKFCNGWALMKEAEERASPELYSEAAKSFLELRSSPTRGQLPHLALANAAICKALGAGMQYQQTRDVQFYSELKKQTETAAEFFRMAGFRKTEAWTRGTQRLFDAFIFISDAETETDPSRKTTLYHMAENHLELAARLYGEAGFPAREEEALSHLDRIREEKQVLLAPLEALSQIPLTTATSLALAPRGRGEPGGIQRFEEAYVVGDLNVPQREITLGSELVIDLEIANVGKSPATLVKLQSVLPEGFELAGQHNLEITPDGQVDFRGRRLEHLNTHQLKVAVKAIHKGSADLRPRLFYVDDSGTYKTYQFQPTTVTVLDVGFAHKPIALAPLAIPSTLNFGEEFRFNTERSREVFHRLVKEFLIDYMSKRLYVDKAGWRTLVQIVRETKIPRSALYGPRGRDGPVLAELERRGLVESRIFPKERGRGGAVKRVRVAYDNAIVKKIVEQSVIENK